MCALYFRQKAVNELFAEDSVKCVMLIRWMENTVTGQIKHSVIYYRKLCSRGRKLMRVLIVDDDHIICRCLRQGINWEELECHEIEVCYNGAQAFEYIYKHKPDIVISDVKMPVMDGKELCRKVYEEFPEISFIFLSGYEDFVTAQLAIRYHAKGYILKPLDRNSLHELEELIKDTFHQKENKEFIRKIIKDEYRDYLETILEEKDKEALEQFFSRINECYDQRQLQYTDVWLHLMQPLFSYRYQKKKDDTSHLFVQERRLEEMLDKMEENARNEFVLKQYKEEIDSTENIAEANELVWQIQSVVKEKYMDADFNVNMLGQILHMSPTYIGRVYMEETGVRIVDYISQRRLDVACNLLKNTNKSVKEVAESVGYSDANYFTKMFRKKMDVKPLEYRYGKRGTDEG